MPSQLQTTRVDLTGLLEVMGRNLYSTPSVAVRELVQNAHDACVRRQLEQPDDDFSPRIHLYTDLAKRRLIIEDNGAGLTENEIVEHLATIGSGYTRVLRNQTQSEEMIGYFGLGFLSAYVVSKKVEMQTCSYQQDDRAWQFLSKNGQQFSITEGLPRAIGSKVILDLAEDFYDLSDANYLDSLLRKYCRLLPIEIYLNDSDQPVNGEPAPWKLDTTTNPLRLKKLRQEFISNFDTQFEPLCTIPVGPTDDCDVHGLIWLHDGSSYANADNRRANIFIRGMYITSDARDLMPGWSGFCSCILESSRFTPTASREDLQKDSFYYQVQAHLYDSLVNGLITISQNDSDTWQRIITRHNEGLLGAAVGDDLLFDALRDVLKIPTSEGEHTLPEILRHSENRLLVTMEQKGNYEEILCRAQKIPVIYGYRYAVLSFTRKYAEYRSLPHHLLGTREASASLFREVDPGETTGKLLTRLFARDHEKLITVSFEPSYIPLLLIADEEAILKQRIEEDDAARRISTSALGLAKMYTAKLQDESLAYLYLNMSSPLIEAICSQPDEQQKTLADLVRSFMVIIGHNDNLKTVGSVAQELENYTKSLLNLINQEP